MSAHLQRERVLVVDDNNFVRGTLSMMLENRYEVLSAHSVSAALMCFWRDQPDVVLLDVNMPRRDGFDGLREIRRLDPAVGVIMMAGHPSAAVISAAYRGGADGFLSKPFTLNELHEKIQDVLDSRGMIAATRERISRQDEQP